MNALMDDRDRNQAQQLQLQLQLQLRLLRAVKLAIDKLARVAAGKQVIRHDSELRACVALARLAPKWLLPPDDAGLLPLRDISHPDNSHEETLRLLEQLEARDAK